MVPREGRKINWLNDFKMGPGRVELPTSRLSGVRSNHLSYEPQIEPGKITGPAPYRDSRPSPAALIASRTFRSMTSMTNGLARKATPSSRTVSWSAAPPV